MNKLTSFSERKEGRGEREAGDRARPGGGDGGKKIRNYHFFSPLHPPRSACAFFSRDNRTQACRGIREHVIRYKFCIRLAAATVSRGTLFTGLRPPPPAPLALPPLSLRLWRSDIYDMEIRKTKF